MTNNSYETHMHASVSMAIVGPCNGLRPNDLQGTTRIITRLLPIDI